MNGQRFQAGFTLLEILVVVALIGVLMTIGTSAYINAVRHGRDSRRVGDLKTIQGAMEQYFTDNNGQYPASCLPGPTYLPQGFPVDPKTGAAYSFAAPGNCTSTTYCTCVQLEGTTTGGNSNRNDCTSFVSGQYFCVMNLQ